MHASHYNRVPVKNTGTSWKRCQVIPFFVGDRACFANEDSLVSLSSNTVWVCFGVRGLSLAERLLRSAGFHRLTYQEIKIS